MLEAVCPNGHRLQIPPEHAGMKLRCPACNAIFQLAGVPQNPGASGLGLQGAAVAGQQPAGQNPAAAPGAPAQQAADQPPARWAGSDAPAAGAAAPPMAPPPPPAPGQQPAQRLGAAPLRRIDLGRAARTWGQIALMVGLVLVLSARGCDGLALRNIARVKANLTLAQNRLKDQEFEEGAGYKKQVDDLQLQQAVRDGAQKSLDDVRTKYERQRAELNLGEWYRLSTADRDAELENRGWAYWREMAFVAGSILLSLGLIALIMYGLNAERYLAFGMLSIILFSLYIGGTAWFGSIVGTMSAFR